MAKDPRYVTMKKLVDGGLITEFKELIVSFPPAQFAKDLRKNYNRINNCIKNPEKFTLEEIDAISRLIEVEFDKLIRLIRTEYLNKLQKDKQVVDINNRN